MAISGIGNSSGFDASKFAANVVKKLDTNSDGSVDKAEFVKGLSAQGVSYDDASKRFDSIDSKQTGKITQADIASDIKSKGGKNAPPQGSPPKAPPAGGPPAGGAQAAGTSSQATSNKTYDKADTNQDGTVSSQEALLYQIKHPTDASAKDKSSSVSTSTGQKIGGNVDEKV